MYGSRNSTSPETLRLVTFSLDEERYAVPVMRARGFLEATDLRPVPRPPLHVAGILPYQGAAVPVLDTRSRLGLPPGRSERVLLVECLERQVGLLVDTVHQVASVPTGAVRRPPHAIASPRNDHVQGIVESDGHLILILDLDRLMFLPELGGE